MFSSDLHSYVRALFGADAVRLGPFLAGLDDHDSGPFRNYAVPDDHAAPSAADVDALVQAFHHRGRTPRLEYLPALSPQLEPRLLDAGYVVERRLPVMTCPPNATGPLHSGRLAEPGGVRVRLAESLGDWEAAARAQNEAYGVTGATEHDVARLESTVARGGLVAVALDADTGRGLGAGLCAPPHDGVSELAAVGVRACHRRRGIATAVTALLTRECPRHGITTPFLTPAGEDEQRLYHRVGYRPVTTMLHISQPSTASEEDRETASAPDTSSTRQGRGEDA